MAERKDAALEVGQSDRRDADLQSANERLLARVQELEGMNAALRRQVKTDELTGAFSKAGLCQEIGKLLTLWSPSKEITGPIGDEELVRRITIARFDGDHFKKVNDTYGHAAGDEAIKAIATALLRSFRPIDRVARLSGDEFAVAIVNAGPDAILRKLGASQEESTPARIGKITCRFDGQEISLTVSGGLAKFELLEPENGETAEQTARRSIEVALQKADKAAYVAKQVRDVVVSYDREDS